MDEHAYEVEAIHAERRSRKRGVEYLVKWLGWPDADNTWQRADTPCGLRRKPAVR